MTEASNPDAPDPKRDPDKVRSRFARTRFSVPKGRVAEKENAQGVFSLTASEPQRLAGSDYLSVKTSLHSRLLDLLNQPQYLSASDQVLEQTVDEFVADVLGNEDLALNEFERTQLADDLMEETLGVGPLAPLLGDPAVTDILVNRYDQVFIERFGKLETTNVQFRDSEHLVRIIQRIAARVGVGSTRVRRWSMHA